MWNLYSNVLDLHFLIDGLLINLSEDLLARLVKTLCTDLVYSNRTLRGGKGEKRAYAETKLEL